ncbi:MAG: beta-phosphoglucomutase [Cyclobacteriaceae bacterium]|nr:beta-phosphoglucomutase [Cyclobacteriaceae bacterium]
MIQACIFDLDGVIVDTAHYHFLAWRRLAAELGFELTPEANERLKGVSRMRSLEIILEIGGLQRSREEMDAMATRKNAWFVEYIEAMQAHEIFPGITDLFAKIRQAGMKIGLASSSKNADTVLRKLGIAHHFDAIVDGTMIIHTKPDPEIFLLSASKLGVVPAQCVVFEDAQAGVEAAKRAGMRCVGIGKKEQLGAADIVVAQTGAFDFSALLKF